MRVQFNLLPNVKQEYIGALRTKRTILTGALIVSAVSFLIFLFMLATVYVINKKQISDAGKDINNYKSQINNIPDINKILTVQSQLSSIVGLQQNKHISSRIFTYLPLVTPKTVNIGRFSVDYASNTIEESGTSDSQKSINTFIDTLKYTTYKLNGQPSGKQAFPTVVESTFGFSNGKANYSLSITFDPALFTSSQAVELVVPAGKETTRSVSDDPSALFNGENSGQKDQGGTQ
jgi:Tfp pilus assembly protein PilN